MLFAFNDNKISYNYYGQISLYNLIIISAMSKTACCIFYALNLNPFATCTAPFVLQNYSFITAVYLSHTPRLISRLTPLRLECEAHAYRHRSLPIILYDLLRKQRSTILRMIFLILLYKSTSLYFTEIIIRYIYSIPPYSLLMITHLSLNANMKYIKLISKMSASLLLYYLSFNDGYL